MRFADEDRRAQPPHRVHCAGRKAAAPDDDQVRLEPRNSLQIDAVRPADSGNALRGDGIVGEFGRADDAVTGADRKELLGKVRGEADNSRGRLRQFDARAGVVDRTDRDTRGGGGEQRGRHKRARAVCCADPPHASDHGRTVAAGSVTKPIFASPACCAVDRTKAMRS